MYAVDRGLLRRRGVYFAHCRHPGGSYGVLSRNHRSEQRPRPRKRALASRRRAARKRQPGLRTGFLGRPVVALRNRAPEHFVASRGQSTDEPVRLDRVPRPGLSPAVLDARLHRLEGNLAALAIEQWEFSTGLVETTLEIATLCAARPHGCLNGDCIMIRRRRGGATQVHGGTRKFAPLPVGAHAVAC